MAKIFTSNRVSRRRRKPHPIKRLLEYGQQYGQQMKLATAGSILNKLFDLAPPALIGVAVDIVVKQEDSTIARLGVRDIFGNS